MPSLLRWRTSAPTAPRASTSGCCPSSARSGCSSPRAGTGASWSGFSFCTLERIGGTPCLLWGLASIKRFAKRDAVSKAVTADQFRRAVLAFPDEDVLIGTRFIDPGAFQAFKGLEDICPRPGHKATGEERAWSRRLAKRFGAEGRIDDRSFVVQGDGSPVGVFDFAGAEAREPSIPTWPPSSSPWITTATTCSSPSGGAWPRIWRRATPPEGPRTLHRSRPPPG